MPPLRPRSLTLPDLSYICPMSIDWKIIMNVLLAMVAYAILDALFLGDMLTGLVGPPSTT